MPLTVRSRYVSASVPALGKLASPMVVKTACKGRMRAAEWDRQQHRVPVSTRTHASPIAYRKRRKRTPSSIARRCRAAFWQMGAEQQLDLAFARASLDDGWKEVVGDEVVRTGGVVAQTHPLRRLG